MLDIATVSAVVAALVTVVGNAFGIDKKYRALLAIAIASTLWFIPREWGEQVLMALIIGLTASGMYSQVKPRDNQNELLQLQMREQFRQEVEEKENEKRKQQQQQQGEAPQNEGDSNQINNRTPY